MTGSEYASAVAEYVARRFAGRDLKVYREVKVGKTIIGKNRSIDVFCICARTNKAFAIECKYQDSQGTVDEKIPYALDDLKALPMAACIAYAGEGFSGGVLHMLQASPQAAYCLPAPSASRTDTRELDQLLAAHFGWWDVLVENKQPVQLDSRSAAVAEQPTLLADQQPVWSAPSRAQGRPGPTEG